MAQDTALITVPADGRWIIVSENNPHIIAVYEDGKVVRSIRSFSTGRKGHLTPTGKFTVSRRYKTHFSSLYKTSGGHGAPMPFSVFFVDAVAFHQGDPATESHGCIHLGKDDAEWVFDWTDPKNGTVHVWVLLSTTVK